MSPHVMCPDFRDMTVFWLGRNLPIQVRLHGSSLKAITSGLSCAYWITGCCGDFVKVFTPPLCSYSSRFTYFRRNCNREDHSGCTFMQIVILSDILSLNMFFNRCMQTNIFIKKNLICVWLGLLVSLFPFRSNKISIYLKKKSNWDFL